MYSAATAASSTAPSTSTAPTPDPSREAEAVELTEEERQTVAEYVHELKQKAAAADASPFSLTRSRLRLPDKVRRVAMNELLEAKLAEIPSDDEVTDFIKRLESSPDLTKLDDSSYITYADFMRIHRDLPSTLRSFVKPATLFAKCAFDEDASGRVNIDVLVQFVYRKTAFFRNRVALSFYDAELKGALTQQQFLEYYDNEIVPAVDALAYLDDRFKQYYDIVVRSKFFVFLDPMRQGRIRIADILASGFIDEAFGLQANPDDSETELVASFKLLDVTGLSFLTADTFRAFNHAPTVSTDGTLTAAFIDRYFEMQGVLTGSPVMTFEDYVEFLLMFQNLTDPVSLAFFFRLLDLNEDGYISEFELRYFYTDLRTAYDRYLQTDGAMPCFEDTRDQLFDMVAPREPYRATLQDLIESKQGHHFVLTLISHVEFYRYENRESQEADDEDDNNNDLDSVMPVHDTFLLDVSPESPEADVISV
ncbi:serine/threonine-protein phosphatase 2A regulatory subunit B'' subunit gamma-like protein [Aphelenchoides avenae]|nr:serine/threonine-protein phosphatase 2A regulatory subunit B'' subunit gamma-like protein [Aphelenchus avenae]